MTRLRATLCLAIATAGSLAIAEEPLWTYDGAFHEKIAAADRLVVRPRVFRADEKYDQAFINKHSKPIFVVQDVGKLREIAEHLDFESPQKVEHYFFRGFPILEWYRGEEKLATAASKVNCLGGADFGGDVRLTKRSAEWIADWLAGHGFNWTRERLDRYLHREAVAADAAPVLAARTPPELPAARLQAESDAEADTEEYSPTDWFDILDAQFDRRLRAASADRDDMYQKLFRLVGCLPMVWDSPYQGAQRDAFAFLGRSPQEELDQAFRNALRSGDKEAVRGAAWVLFVEVNAESEEEFADEERVFPKTRVTEGDLERWFSLFADSAYANPFPENRRVVLRRLVEFPLAAEQSMLRAALGDSDQTVRRLAIEVLWRRAGAAEMALLREMAAGEIEQRAALALPRDYGEGVNGKWGGRDSDAGDYDDTDREAAEAAISRIELAQRRRREAAAAGSAH